MKSAILGLAFLLVVAAAFALGQAAAPAPKPTDPATVDKELIATLLCNQAREGMGLVQCRYDFARRRILWSYAALPPARNAAHDQARLEEKARMRARAETRNAEFLPLVRQYVDMDATSNLAF